MANDRMRMRLRAYERQNAFHKLSRSAKRLERTFGRFLLSVRRIPLVPDTVLKCIIEEDIYDQQRKAFFPERK